MGWSDCNDWFVLLQFCMDTHCVAVAVMTCDGTDSIAVCDCRDPACCIPLPRNWGTSPRPLSKTSLSPSSSPSVLELGLLSSQLFYNAGVVPASFQYKHESNATWQLVSSFDQSFTMCHCWVWKLTAHVILCSFFKVLFAFCTDYFSSQPKS